MSTIPLMSTAPGSGTTTRGVAMGRVMVAARLQLIAQAVGAGLRGRGINAEPLPWEQVPRRASRELEAGDVLVLLDDLTSVQDLEMTCDLIVGTPARCVVLTRRPTEPVWGALLAAGAAAVLTSDGSLEEIDAVVNRVATGESVTDEEQRARLVNVWEEWRAEDEFLRARVALLSPRERQILVLLAEGSRVVDIVDTLGVAETTVRSQVKSMRRKLGVDSQLGAVAVLHRLGLAGGRPPTIPPPRRGSG